MEEGRFTRAIGTIDGTSYSLHDSATLDYADTNEHALEDTPRQIEYYKDYIVEFKITYAGNPDDVNLILGVATSNIELTGDNAVSQLSSDYWETKTIDLNTAGGTSTEYYRIRITANEINGKNLYTKYQYSGDPSNDPTVEATLNMI